MILLGELQNPQCLLLQISKLRSLLDASWSESIGCPVIYTWRQILLEETLSVAVENDTLDLTEVYEEAVRDRKSVIEAAKKKHCPEVGVESRLTDEISDKQPDEIVGGDQRFDQRFSTVWREVLIAFEEAKRLRSKRKLPKKVIRRDEASEPEGAFAFGATVSDSDETMMEMAREVCERITNEGISREFLGGVVQKWNPNHRTGFIAEAISGRSYFFRQRYVIRNSDTTSGTISRGAAVTFTVGDKAPTAGRKPEAEHVFLTDEDWSNSTALAVVKAVLKSEEEGKDSDPATESERGTEEEEMSTFEPEIVRYLKNHDVEQKQRDFDREPFSCGVCFEDKLGKKCTRFEECGHVFCRACMAEYFRLQIREGQVNALNCPTSECETQASHHQVNDGSIHLDISKLSAKSNYQKLCLQF